MGVSYKRDGVIGFITLEREEKLNALNDEMTRAVEAAVYELDDDPEALVGLISGAGRAFCSGADVIEKQLRPREERVRFGGPSARGALIQEALLGVTNWKPIIAAVHGYVMGAGLRLALHCEMIIASEDTQFQVTETSRGLDAASYFLLLAQRSSSSFASEAALTGRFWSASEGLQAGVVNEVVPTGDHVKRATQVAEEIASHPRGSVRGVVRSRRASIALTEDVAKWTRDTSLPLSADFEARAQAFATRHSRAGL